MYSKYIYMHYTTHTYTHIYAKYASVFDYFSVLKYIYNFFCKPLYVYETYIP